MSLCDRKIGPYDCCSVVQGDCLELMKQLPAFTFCASAVITDPPYGCDKAEWDSKFPRDWYAIAKNRAPMVVIITGSSGLRDSVDLVGKDFVDVIAARNMNGMTRGPIGFGNWLSAVIANGKPRQGPNAFDFCVSGEMPEHPSPKPMEYMEKLVERLTEEGQTILDPFCGSGTTLVAAKKLGRHFLGFEISPEYCAIARDRLARIDAQPSLFQPKPEQIEFPEVSQ